MEEWLEQRLTPYKQKEPRWRDLAKALQEYWDLYNTPYLERLDNLRSVFSAHDEDIETLMREAGIQFEVALPIMQGNRSLAYAWRSYEVHRKDRQHVIEGILSRDYSNLFVRWIPLYAPKDLEYGHRFLSPMEFELYNYTMDDMYQTYRGILVTNLTHLHQNGSDKYDFGAAAKRKMDILRPAHITYEGALYFQVFKAEFPITIRNSATHEFLTMPLPWIAKRRFDESRADDFRLDDRLIFIPHGTINTIRYISEPVEIWPFSKLWSLDSGSHADGFYWALHGAEGKQRGRFGSLGDGSTSFFLHDDKIESFLANKSAKERLSGNIFSLIRRFDDYAADAGAADLGGLGSESSETKVSRLDAWPFDKAWSLDAGSVIDGEYLALAGIEGTKRGRHGTLGSKSSPVSILASGNLKAGAVATSSANLTGKAFIPTQFDLEKSDSVVADYKPLSSGGRDASTGGSFWSMPLWGLDLATCEKGRLLGLAGKEGAELSRSGSISTERHSFLNKVLSHRYQVSPALSSNDKMAPRSKTISGSYTGDSSKLTRSESASARVRRRALPIYPSLDDVPADFSPLDMNYQPQESYLL